MQLSSDTRVHMTWKTEALFVGMGKKEASYIDVQRISSLSREGGKTEYFHQPMLCVCTKKHLEPCTLGNLILLLIHHLDNQNCH